MPFLSHSVLYVQKHNSMKPSLLRRHLETKHANLKNKPQEFFERELRRLLSSKTCMKATDTINKKGLEASYMMSYRVARTGKHHTIVEDFNLPAAADMAGTMLREKAQKTLQTMPSSNNTVSASRVTQLSKPLHRSASCATRDSEFMSRLCRSRLRPGDPWGVAQLTQRRPG